jgi:hypothetical protein
MTRRGGRRVVSSTPNEPHAPASTSSLPAVPLPAPNDGPIAWHWQQQLRVRDDGIVFANTALDEIYHDDDDARSCAAWLRETADWVPRPQVRRLSDDPDDSNNPNHDATTACCQNVSSTIS